MFIKSADQLVNDSDLAYLYRICVTSKLVEDNSIYRNVASRTIFVPDMEDTTLNAYAGVNDAGGYRITVLGGLVHWLSHFAFIKTLFDVGMKLHNVECLVAWTRAKVMSSKCDGQMLTNLTKNMVTSVKVNFAKYNILSNGFEERWRSNLLDCIHSAIAHELGHLCLGHCNEEVENSTILSANRNIERQADLFSFSVIQSGTGVAEKSIGAILVMTSFFCLNPDIGNNECTHPSSAERIENAIQSFAGIVSKPHVVMIRKMMMTILKTKIHKLHKKTKS